MKKEPQLLLVLDLIIDMMFDIYKEAGTEDLKKYDRGRIDALYELAQEIQKRLKP